MKKLLFLDFDGVLNGDAEAPFSKRELFEPYLLKMPELDIVISSTWWESHSLAALKKMCFVALHDRIIGVTPILNRDCEQGGRQREIEAFLYANNLNYTNSAWVALDDLACLFDVDCPNLILVNMDQGFDDDGIALLQWYEQIIKR